MALHYMFFRRELKNSFLKMQPGFDSFRNTIQDSLQQTVTH